MKFGLMKYPINKESNIFNIGDYIQSLAVKQFFCGREYILVNREHLDDYYGDEIKLCMNGWFMHNPEHWPPSSQIHPLFVAFHLNSTVDAYLLSDKSVQYFKKYEPIGCRDFRTEQVLKEKGVRSYFSGCMTLTLGFLKKYGKVRSDNIYFTDVYFTTIKSPFKYLKCIRYLLFHLDIIKKISSKIGDSSTKFVNILRALSFYEQYSSVFSDDLLGKAIFIKHEISSDGFATDEDKFVYAEKLLDLYADAKLVVTSRIHCALPCLALETPVIYADKNNADIIDNCRLGGLKDFFNVISMKSNRYKMEFDCNSTKITSDTVIKNKKNYLQYREKLINMCCSFFEV